MSSHEPKLFLGYKMLLLQVTVVEQQYFSNIFIMIDRRLTDREFFGSDFSIFM